MKRRSLLIVVALLCMASLMAAMAFTRAYVANDLSFAVVATNEAKIALRAGDHAGVAKLNEDGLLELDFSPGFQNDSKYTYENLFYIKNNTDKDIYVGLRFKECYINSNSATEKFPVGLHTISTSKALFNSFADYNNALVLGGPEFRSGAYEGRMIKLVPDEEVGVNFNFNLMGYEGLQDKELSLQVHAKDSVNGAWQD